MGKWQVDEGVIVDCDAHKCANQFEVNVWLVSLSVKPIGTVVFVELEHHVFWIEYFFHDALKELLGNTSHVNSRFILKSNT
jgi:hypothetical protein